MALVNATFASISLRHPSLGNIFNVVGRAFFAGNFGIVLLNSRLGSDKGSPELGNTVTGGGRLGLLRASKFFGCEHRNDCLGGLKVMDKKFCSLLALPPTAGDRVRARLRGPFAPMGVVMSFKITNLTPHETVGRMERLWLKKEAKPNIIG